MRTPIKDRTNSTPIAPARQISISEIGRREANLSNDHLRILKELIAQNDDKYPGIDRWFETKVVSGLKSGERIAYVAFEGDRAIAASVLKLGKSAKFCHLRIDEKYQDADLGQIFFIQMTQAVMGYAKEIHFTLPESLWQTKGEFFKSFGFARTERTSLHYRKDDTELSCSAPVSTVWSSALRKIPRLLSRLRVGMHSTCSNVLMSIKPPFAEMVLGGSKSIEIRKRFSNKWVGHDVLLYASRPLGAVLGKATIRRVIQGLPADIWSQFGPEIGCSNAEFTSYAGSNHEISAVQLVNVVPFQRPVLLSEMAQIVHEKLSPPQSYFELSLKKNDAWMSALYYAELLQRQSRSKLES